MPAVSPYLQQVIDFYQSIEPATVQQVERLYATNAYFKDPFNEFNEADSIKAVFGNMFHQVDQPRFVVTSVIEQGEQAFLAWDFFFYRKAAARQELRIRGSSHLKFGSNGQITYHRDYWDAAEELYEKIPVLGTIMRLIKRQAQH